MNFENVTIGEHKKKEYGQINGLGTVFSINENQHLENLYCSNKSLMS